MASDQNKDFLISLGYDPTEAKKGLEKATEDLVNFKVQASQISAELTKAQVQQTTTYNAANRAAAQERLADLQTEIASVTGALRGKSDAERAALKERLDGLRQEYAAQKQTLASFDEQIQKINQLKTQYAELRTQISQTRAAQTVLRPQAKGQESFLEKSLGSLNVGEVFQATGILGLGASIPFAIHDIGVRIKEAALGVGEYAEKLTLASEKTGLTVRELQEFDAIGKSVGLTTEDMVTAMRKFSVAVTGAGQAQKQGNFDGLNESAVKSAKLFEALGVSVVSAGGQAKPTQEIFLQLADAFQKIPDGATKARIAVELLGRSGLNLIPFLNKGSAGISEILGQFDGLFPELTKSAEAFDALRISEAEYEAAQQSLRTSLAEGVLPVMAKLLENVAALMGQMSDVDTIDAFGYALKRALGISSEPPVGQREANSLVSMLSGPGKKATVDRDEFQKRLAEFQLASGPTEGMAFGVGPEQVRENFQRRKAAQDEFAKRFPRAGREGSDEELAALSLILEKRVQIVEATKAETDEQKKLKAELDKLLTEKNGGDKTEAIAKARQELQQAIADAGTKTAEARLATVIPPRGLEQNEIASRQRELNALEAASVHLTGEALLTNLQRQKELVRQIADERAKLTALEEKDRKAVEDNVGESESLKQKADAAMAAAERERNAVNDKEVGIAPGSSALDRAIAPSGPAPLPGTVTTDTFTRLFDIIKSRREVVASATQAPDITQEAAQAEVESLQKLLAGLQEEIKLRLQNKELANFGGSLTAVQAEIELRKKNGQELDSQLKQLGQLAGLVKQVNGEIAATSKETGLGAFLSQLKESAGLVSRFSEVFKKSNVPKYAVGIDAATNLVGMAEKKGVDAYGGSGQYGSPDFGSLLKGMEVIFKNFGKDFAEIIKPLSGALQGSPIASGAAAGASIAATGTSIVGGLSKKLGGLMGGPVGSAIQIGGALLGGLFGGQQKNMEAEVQRIRNSINEALDDLRSGLQGAGTTLQELQAQRAKAVADLSGKKGGQKQLDSLLPGLDQQIADLQGQIKKQIDDFHKTTAELSVPEAAGRQTIDQIAQIAAALTQASLAGASAADQVKYLNAAFQDLSVSIGKDLRGEEQQTLDLLQKEIDLQTQKTNLINSAYMQQRQISNSLALSRAATPAQTAALQIREVGIQRDQQLQQLDMQDQLLKAQIDGQAQLFGWTLKDLQSADAKTKLLDQQVQLQKQITAETISQITANQSFLKSLSAGLIPALPAGLLPSNFTGWTPGSQFSPTPGTPGAPVQIIINAPGGNPKSITDGLSQAFRNTNIGRRLGFQ
jgi:hypothetical protein